MASRNGNYAMENAAYQIQHADISFKTERKAKKDLGGVSDVPPDPNDSFQKKETNGENPNSEAVYDHELLTKIRRMMYLTSFLLVLILLTAVVSLASSLSRLNSSLGMLQLPLV